MKDGMNRKNLQKLATFLMYGELPKEVKFNMEYFCRNGSGLNYVTKPPCGTSACAVGFAPFAGIRKFKTEDFGEYSYRTLINSDLDRSAWRWCFELDWTKVDNTPKGAAKRIQYLLDNGLDAWDGYYDADARKLYARTKVKS